MLCENGSQRETLGEVGNAVQIRQHQEILVKTEETSCAIATRKGPQKVQILEE